MVQVWNGTDEVKSKTLIQARNEVFEHMAAREKEDQQGGKGQKGVTVGGEGTASTGAEAESKKAVKKRKA